MSEDLDPNPYETWDQSQKHGKGWTKKGSGDDTYTQQPKDEPFTTMKRPKLKRRISKNVLNEEAEIHVIKKRLGADAPKELLMKKFPKETLKRIDYVLVYKTNSSENSGKKSKKSLKKQKRDELRLTFHAAMLAEGLQIQRDVIGEFTYLKIHAPFWRLCKEAENMRLEMPLIGCELYDDDDGGKCFGCNKCLENFSEKHLQTDNEVDFVSAAFVMDKLHVFVDHDKPDVFFRPALRSFLTNHILIQMDVRDKKSDEIDDEPMAKKGLPYMIHKNVYDDSFILHDETIEDPVEKEELAVMKAEFGSSVMFEGESHDSVDARSDSLVQDTRMELNNTWTKFFKYQPLWKIRNYFGEKIALYFAWSGILIWTLWFPTLFGIACFIYGLYLSITDFEAPPKAANVTLVEEAQALLEESLGVIKKAFDNQITPFFSLVICLWGTVFLELWKRKSATLAYEWDVDNFESSELDRPEFIGTHVKPDPVVIGEDTWYYPLYRQLLKFTCSFSVLIFMDPIIIGNEMWYYPLYRQMVKFVTSFSTLIFMVCMVFIAVASVILYRVLIEVDYCTSFGSVGCLLAGTLASSVLNAVTILILGKIYDFLAVKLTDWENHRTQTEYDDALIIKLFAFQFANSYASLFYIAFFRGITYDNGIFGIGSNYQDACGTDNNCMAMLSFQVLILMLAKPLPKFLKDIVIPGLKKIWRKRKFCRKTKVDSGQNVTLTEFIVREHQKPDLGDFTLGEYTEKVIVYGFLMLFAASFPLAPLVALLIHAIDMRVDAKRMIWWYRRPVSRIAQDIGMWQGILEFVNICGVVSNGFLLGFTSEWGSNYDLSGKLLIVIGFEHLVFSVKFIIGWLIPTTPRTVCLAQKRHIVFGFKFLIAGFIPDVPASIRLGNRREKYQVAKIMDKAKKKDTNKVQSGAAAENVRGTISEMDETASNGYAESQARRRKKKKSRKGLSDDESNTIAEESFEAGEESGKHGRKRDSYLRRKASESAAHRSNHSTDNPLMNPPSRLPKLEPLLIPNEPWSNVWGRAHLVKGAEGIDSLDNRVTDDVHSYDMYRQPDPLPDIVDQHDIPDSRAMYSDSKDFTPPPATAQPIGSYPNYDEESV